jgi:demethylmenaquinone methyltransferase / 2-methoxy-6-polyprenyl-1,4-benzoquinol methylase
MADLDGLPTGADKARAVRAMFDEIAPRYDLLNRVMTFGLDIGWRRTAIAALALPPGSLVLDVACGTGDFCRELQARAYRPIGFDVSYGMLSAARAIAPLVQADALALPLRAGAADGVTCGFALRNVTDLTALLAEFARTLRRGGRVAILEVSQPQSKLLRSGHSLYFRRIVPLIGGLLSDRAAYSYLPRSAAYLPPSEQLVVMLQRAGFDHTGVESLGMGAVQLLTGTRG